MKTELDHLRLAKARDNFRNAQNYLVIAAKELEAMQGCDFSKTLKNIKETIGDLAIVCEVLNDALAKNISP